MIMYVCDSCRENNPEGCGHDDRDELRVTPNGEWMCDSCYEYADHEDMENVVPWSDLPMPPEYIAQSELDLAEQKIDELQREIERLTT